MTNDRNVWAYFVIAGFPGSPEDITRLLGLAPDDSAGKGEKRRARGGQEYTVKDSYWEIHGRVSNDLSIDEHVVELLDRLSGLESRLRELDPLTVKKIEVVVRLRPEKARP